MAQAMVHPAIEADYLIVGAGATGMAFADSLLTESNATMVIADRHDRPGGHWNDAYPFVRLHQPAALYGVTSRPLGSGVRDHVGSNAGLYELASGHEVLAHFDQVMRQRLLPSGRVQYFPMSEVDAENTITSLVSGDKRTVLAATYVDATYSQTAVPSTTPPRYSVDPGITCIPPNELPLRAHKHASYVVIGAGKTGIDVCLWLLENGAQPDSIRWVMPRDPWLLSRANYQPARDTLARAVRDWADQVEALAHADSVDEVFERLEACGSLHRIDLSVKPDAYHCATVSDHELTGLRRIGNVIRFGRVITIDETEIILERGAVTTGPSHLHIDCSAPGVPGKPPRPIFEGDRITLQWVRLCQPAFSAALVGYVEATYDEPTEKNEFCRPIAPLNVPVDWLRMMVIELSNRKRWSDNPKIDRWIAECRLDGFNKLLRSADPETQAEARRYGQHVVGAVKNLPRLLGERSTNEERR